MEYKKAIEPVTVSFDKQLNVRTTTISAHWNIWMSHGTSSRKPETLSRRRGSSPSLHPGSLRSSVFRRVLFSDLTQAGSPHILPQGDHALGHARACNRLGSDPAIRGTEARPTRCHLATLGTIHLAKGRAGYTSLQPDLDQPSLMISSGATCPGRLARDNSSAAGHCWGSTAR